uniref:Uncharacterized protein n=1 Tax=Salix viminalis TaxID=40686 RepID=A0A6N2MJ73_SALVM
MHNPVKNSKGLKLVHGILLKSEVMNIGAEESTFHTIHAPNKDNALTNNKTASINKKHKEQTSKAERRHEDASKSCSNMLQPAEKNLQNKTERIREIPRDMKREEKKQARDSSKPNHKNNRKQTKKGDIYET